MREVKADLSNLDEIISRQYEDKIRGIAKDSMQNSWEARIHRKKGTGFKMVYEFFKELDGHKNVLMFEDFGTVGMNDQRWKAFHSHWVTTKGDYQGGIGRWGQGKTLYLFFSSTNRILTESINSDTEKYRYSIRTNVGYWQESDTPDKRDAGWVKKADGSLKLINDFFPSKSRLNHIGTRIWILGVKEELVEEIINGYLAKQLSESWWELIRNYGIDIEVRITQGGKTELEKIDLPQFPKVKDKTVGERISIDKGHGRIRKLKIVLAEEPVAASLRGIAIQRGRMAVCRYDLPSSTPDEIRQRTHGYCMMDEQLDEEMWEIELANHEGFESRKAIWVKLRKKIDVVAEEFLLKYSKGKQIKPPLMNLDEIIRTVNKLVDEHLEGLGRGRKKGGNGGNGKPPPVVHISPWGYQGSNKRFNTGDIMEIKGGVVNTTKNDVFVNLCCGIQDAGGAEFWLNSINKLKIESETRKSLRFAEIDLSALGLSKGKYLLRARLEYKPLDVEHKRTAIFYFEQDPPPTGGWLRKILFKALGGPKANLRNVPINDKGELLINRAYPEIDVVWSSGVLSNRQKAKELGPIIINISLHEAVREVSLKWWQDEKISYDIGEIKKAKDLFDEMWASYLTGR